MFWKNKAEKSDNEELKELKERYQGLIESLMKKHAQADKLIKECAALKEKLEQVVRHVDQ